MSLSTFQKVMLFSCLVLCVSLLLPKILLSRGKKEVGHAEGKAPRGPDPPEDLHVGPGRVPPMMHLQPLEGQAHRGAKLLNSKAYNPEAIAKARGGGGGGRGGGKTNLMGQIIPIYGFGILLYILYILFKITSKGRNVKTDNRFPTPKSENLKRKITDYELAQLQEKLRETEEVMERIVSKAGQSPDSIRRVAAEHEGRLLQQLKEITHVMQEGNLVEGASLGVETQEPSYAEDWEGDPEETHPRHMGPCCQPTCDTDAPGERDSTLATTEELDEGVRDVIEEVGLEGKLYLPTSTPHHRDAEWLETERAKLRDQREKEQGRGCREKEVDATLKAERLSLSREDYGDTRTQEDVDEVLLIAGSADKENLVEAEITAKLGLSGFRNRSKKGAQHPSKSK